jgi:hypothetical protein
VKEILAKYERDSDSMLNKYEFYKAAKVGLLNPFNKPFYSRQIESIINSIYPLHVLSKEKFTLTMKKKWLI